MVIKNTISIYSKIDTHTRTAIYTKYILKYLLFTNLCDLRSSTSIVAKHQNLCNDVYCAFPPNSACSDILCAVHISHRDIFIPSKLTNMTNHDDFKDF